jgi:SAM-dependent methyltransferase
MKKRENCILCGSTDFRFITEVSEQKLVECNSCGLVFMQEYFGVDEYENSHFEDDMRGEIMKSFVDNTAIALLRFAYFLELRRKERISAVEIGSGSGSFLSILGNDRTINYIGLEPSTKSSVFCQKIGLNVCPITFESFIEQYAEIFDFIFAFHVIEHMENPRQFLYDIHNLLADDGIAMIELPILNIAMKRESFGVDYFQKYHLFDFCDHHIERLFDEERFEIISKTVPVNQFPKEKNVLYVLKKR